MQRLNNSVPARRGGEVSRSARAGGSCTKSYSESSGQSKSPLNGLLTEGPARTAGQHCPPGNGLSEPLSGDITGDGITISPTLSVIVSLIVSVIKYG